MIVYAIYTIITLICIRSHIYSFILRFSYFSIIHIFLYFSHAYIYSFIYSYIPIIRVQVLILVLCHLLLISIVLSIYAFLSSVLSFRYVYHIFISYNLIFTLCHLLVTSYILLTYIFMYFIKLSYLMTYTYTFLYSYGLLVLYQTVLSPVGVRNRDSSFDTSRYFSYPCSFTYQIYIYCYFLFISTSFLTMYSN